MIPLLRPLLLGGAGGAIGWSLARKIDITFEEKVEAVEDVSSGATDPRPGEILKYGAPWEGVGQPLVYKNHIVQYDSSRRVPRWVAEHMTRDTTDKEVATRKGLQFSPDPVVPLNWRSENSDYWGSGWSRGHMAAAGNNKHCRESMKQTFFLTNVVPQDIDNNGNYWNRLEIFCRDLVKQFRDVRVISGPLFIPEDYDHVLEIEGDEVKLENVSHNEGSKIKSLPPRPKPMKKEVKHQVIGPNLVSVPTHLFKVIVAEDPELEEPLLAVFIVPNKPLEDVPLTQFQVDLVKLEKFTGLSFLPQLDREKVGNLCTAQGCQMQNYKKFKQYFWERRLKSPWNLKNLEKDWTEALAKGVVNETLIKVYNESKERLLEKEKVRESTDISLPSLTNSKECDTTPVAVAA